MIPRARCRQGRWSGSKLRPLAAALLFGACLLLARCASAPPRPPAAPHHFASWEAEIAAFEAADRAHPPAPGAILFIGSSTIRMWRTLEQDFPGHRVLNRGFGGSEIADAAHFAERIVIPYRPRQVFLRAGGNDIHNGRSPDEVAADFADFVQKVHDALPSAEIVFISLCPAPSRWAEKDQNESLNTKVRAFAERTPRVRYLECFDLSLTPDGRAREDLFVADRLHLNAEGYRLLANRVRPFLSTTRERRPRRPAGGRRRGRRGSDQSTAGSRTPRSWPAILV